MAAPLQSCTKIGTRSVISFFCTEGLKFIAVCPVDRAKHTWLSASLRMSGHIEIERPTKGDVTLSQLKKSRRRCVVARSARGLVLRRLDCPHWSQIRWREIPLTGLTLKIEILLLFCFADCILSFEPFYLFRLFVFLFSGAFVCFINCLWSKRVSSIVIITAFIN